MSKDIKFCPGCFALRNRLSLLDKTDKYKCIKCACVFPLGATMISEDTVRTYVAGYPKSRGHLLWQLNKALND